MEMNIKKMLIKILFKFRSGPYGGANQFLKALKESLITLGHYNDDPSKADVFLFNSHHDLQEALEMRRRYPDKIMIHRVDGPMRLYNEPSDPRDEKVIKAARLISDATVFQSNWSMKKNIELGWPETKFYTIIGNAPNTSVYNKDNLSSLTKNGKIKLIATSWSKNLNKGFDVYEYLDANLDFDRYQMNFIGNSPVRFENIKHWPPCNSGELAEWLKKSDIFITGSRNDPCSNSLIEALHCGLPAIVFNDGGHPEILGRGGLCFNKPEEIPELIDSIRNSYKDYQNAINVKSIDEIAREYLDFARSLLANARSGKLAIKKPSLFERLSFRFGS